MSNKKGREGYPATSALLEESFERLERIFDFIVDGKGEDSEGWTLVDPDKDGIRIYKGREAGIHVLGYGKVNASAEKIAELITGLELEMRKKWDTLACQMEILERFDEKGESGILLIQVESPSRLVSNRDFVFMRDIKRKDNGSILVNSVTLEGAEGDHIPQQKGIVRGSFPLCGFVIRPIANTSTTTTTTTCEVIYTTVVNLNGWIPSAVAAIGATNQPLMVARIRDLLDGKL